MKRIIPIHAAGRRAAGPAAPAAMKAGAELPLSLYVHLPWCVEKCPYCDFNSHATHSANALSAGIPEDAYVDALIADLEAALPLVWGRRVSTIFFGGGTPSLFSGEAIDRLLKAFRARLTILPDAEVTLEANPGTVEAARFAAFRDAGINRLSLGIQSFNPKHLRALGRIHDDVEAKRAIEIARQHFANFNLDLMYGLPGQTIAEAIADLECALAFSPPHLSCYQLTLEPNTAFAAAPPTLPDPDACADMQEAIEARLADAAFTHYETSAFAQAGRQCRHNLNYWTFGDYLGIGAGAHSKLTLPAEEGITVRREMRWKRPEAYLSHVAAGEPVQEAFAVPASELAFEFMMNALRLNEGFPAALFAQRTGLPLVTIEAPLARAQSAGLLVRDADRPPRGFPAGQIAPTLRGRRFLNRLLQIFLADEGDRKR